MPTSGEINAAIETLCSAKVPRELTIQLEIWNVERLRVAAGSVKTREDVEALFAGLSPERLGEAGIV